VYAPSDHRGRLIVWDQLRALKQHIKFPFMLMGDFNEVIAIAERKGASQLTVGMRELSGLLQDLQFIDLDIDQKFTWMRKNAASRIDRILVTKEFVEQFQNLRVRCKNRMLSDHTPLVIFTSETVWGPCPFRTLDIWLEEPKFLDVFKKEWLQLTSLSFVQKLTAMKGPSRRWNPKVFGHIDLKIQAYQEELSRLD